MGEKETKSFYKLYLLPSVFHCGGGAGCYDRSDVHIWFDKIVGWVEKGIEPRAIVGVRKDASGKDIRTWLFCPYLMKARYTGQWDINEAANFICVEITPVR